MAACCSPGRFAFSMLVVEVNRLPDQAIRRVPIPAVIVMTVVSSHGIPASRHKSAMCRPWYARTTASAAYGDAAPFAVTTSQQQGRRAICSDESECSVIEHRDGAYLSCAAEG
jgi:hypothetical protein